MTQAVEEAFSWIYKMIFTLIVAVIAVALVGLVITYQLNTAQLQGDVMLSRILYDPHGYWLTDEKGVLHPGVIDKNLFTATHTETVFTYPENYGGAHLILYSNGRTDEVTINTPSYEQIKFSVDAGIKKGGTIQTYSLPVVVDENGIRSSGVLVINLARAETT